MRLDVEIPMRESKIHSFLITYKSIQSLVPIILAIVLSSVISISVHTHNQFQSQRELFFAWGVINTIPGLLFSYVSDKGYRKEVLIWMQVAGLIGGVCLYLYGADIWVILALASTLNLVPIATAAIIDKLPHFSHSKLISVSYIAKYLPWVFYSLFKETSLPRIVFIASSMMAANILLTYFLFKKEPRPVHRSQAPKNSYFTIKIDRKVPFTLIAFLVAQIALYATWLHTEYKVQNLHWVDFSNYAAVIGFFGVLLYTRLPHISIITLLYTIGFGFFMASIAMCLSGVERCESSLLFGMVCFSLIDAMTFPFVADSVMSTFDAKYKATTLASLYFVANIAASGGESFLQIFRPLPIALMCSMATLLLLAAIIQKLAELNPRSLSKW